jgi:hypothetical protein
VPYALISFEKYMRPEIVVIRIKNNSTAEYLKKAPPDPSRRIVSFNPLDQRATMTVDSVKNWAKIPLSDSERLLARHIPVIKVVTVENALIKKSTFASD